MCCSVDLDSVSLSQSHSGYRASNTWTFTRLCLIDFDNSFKGLWI